MKQKSDKKESKKGSKSDAIGIFSSISKEKTSFFEQKDNSWWWTFGIFLLTAGFVAIWAVTTF
jgi:hypothetical protein